VRATVAQALADCEQQDAMPQLLRRLEIESDSFVRDTMMRSLKQLNRLEG
jgi:hypothetical protein